MPPAPPVTIATSVTVRSLLVRSGTGLRERRPEGIAGGAHRVAGDREDGLEAEVAVDHAVVRAVVDGHAGRAQVVAVLLRLDVERVALRRLDLGRRQPGGVAEQRRDARVTAVR